MNKAVLGLCVLFLLAGCTAADKARRGDALAKEPNIRVLVAESQSILRISSSAGLVVKTANGITLLSSDGNGTLNVTAAYPSLNFRLDPDDKVAVAEGEVIVAPKPKSTLKYDGVQYSGVMRVVFKDTQVLSLVNTLPVEVYLEGVLPHEIGNPGADAYDALKSQAVAARTYAIGKMKQRKDGVFDVHDTVMDQVYSGLNGRTRAATAAVRDTRGRVLRYGGETVKAYYCSCCGGHTSDIRQVWPDREPAEYLHGVRDRDRKRHQPFCSGNRYFRWRYSFSGRELGDILRVTLPRTQGVSPEEVGALRDIRVEERSPSGRVTKLVIETTERDFTITGDRIRWVLVTDVARGKILPSVMFRLDKVKERDSVAMVSIVGGGNGHGVGMCQNGSIAMAKQGYTYQMILSHYYPGCTVERMY